MTSSSYGRRSRKSVNEATLSVLLAETMKTNSMKMGKVSTHSVSSSRTVIMTRRPQKRRASTVIRKKKLTFKTKNSKAMCELGQALICSVSISIGTPSTLSARSPTYQNFLHLSWRLLRKLNRKRRSPLRPLALERLVLLTSLQPYRRKNKTRQSLT